MPKTAKWCSVVVGFDTNTDYAIPRQFNSNPSNQSLFKLVIESKGRYCVQAGKTCHSDKIKVANCQQLFSVAIVEKVADERIGSLENTDIELVTLTIRD